MRFYQDIFAEITSYFKQLDPNVDIDKLIPKSPFTHEKYPELLKTKEDEEKYIIRHKALNLLERYLNYQNRHIETIPRHVYCSRELEEKIKEGILDSNMVSAIEMIREELSKGRDVSGHLSKLADWLDKEDALLDDWSIYHFHLGNDKESPSSKYYKRTGLLLMVYIPRHFDNAYLLDVSEEHRNPLAFARQGYLKIIDDNWPELLERFRFSGIKTEFGCSDEERLQLRRAGINTLENINGDFFANPGGGITSAKTSVKCQLAKNRINNKLLGICKSLEEHNVPYKVVLNSNSQEFIVKNLSSGKYFAKVSLKLST